MQKYYNEHKIPGTEIIFSQEKKPVGTGGAVKKAKRLIKSKIFMVLNGDCFSEFNAENFIEFYEEKKASLSSPLLCYNCNPFSSDYSLHPIFAY